MRVRIRKTLRIMGIATGCLLVFGMLYQPLASALETRRFPAPGRLVEVGGHRLHINCEGQGSPTVVLEAGLGGSSLDWSLVAPDLAGETRVCAYDRAGYGWSDPADGPRSSAETADELHALLIRAGEPGPYVLVAHSLGGLHARLFAARYPSETAGMVLVDPTSDDPIPPEARTELDQQTLATLEGTISEAHQLAAKVNHVGAYLSRFSVHRVLSSLGALPEGLGGIEAKLPADAQGPYHAVSSTSRFFDALYAETAAIPASIKEAREAAVPPSLPLVVIRPRQTSEGSLPGVSDAALAVLKRYEGREPLLQQSARSRLVLVEGSGHYVQLDQPQVVTDTIKEVVLAARRFR